MAEDDLFAMYDSTYLGAWSLKGREVTLTIQRIVGGTVVGERGIKSKKPLVYFVGVKKPLCLSKTDAKTLRSLFGTAKASQLAGKSVILYPTETQGRGGGTVDCIRIKNVLPKGDAGPPPAIDEVPVDEEMRANQMEQAK